MEGRWRVVTAVVVCALVVVTAGCGDSGSGVGATGDGNATMRPERTFAPVIELAADEPWRPMSARWLIDRSVMWFAEDVGCPDRLIAVGRTMSELRGGQVDWIFPKGLGGSSGGPYYRNPHDRDCENDTELRFYADQLTRPHDDGPRAEGLDPGEGFYFDLDDAARPGPRWGARVSVYVERSDEGDGAVRLTYWTLFGMDGQPGAAGAHEGDWERVDVLLDEVDGDRYEPRAVQTVHPGPDAAGAAAAEAREEVDWAAVRTEGGTHPVVRAARATHTMSVSPRGAACAACVRLRAWRTLRRADRALWYGFGGAWGEVGPTDATTGPLGPHGLFPTDDEKPIAAFGG